MPALDVLDAWLAAHHGVVGRAQMAEIGFGRRQIDRLVAQERLVPLASGIYRSPAHTVGRHQLMAAACLAEPRAAITSTTAGSALGLRAMRDRRVHALVPHEAKLVIPGVVTHRSRLLGPEDLAPRRSDGIRFTTTARTVVEAAAVIGVRRTVSVIEQVLAERRVTLPALVAADRRLFHPRRRGSVVFRQGLASKASWRGVARSELEITVREAIRQGGLPQPVVNHRVRLPTGEPYELDLAWLEWKVAVEVDHPFWHDGVVESTRDKRRDRKLLLHGWRVVRFPEAEITGHLPELIEDLGGILELQGWTRAAA